MFIDLMCTGILAGVIVAAAIGRNPTALDWTGAGPDCSDVHAPYAWQADGYQRHHWGKTTVRASHGPRSGQ